MPNNPNPMMGQNQPTTGVPSNLSPAVISDLQQNMMAMPLDQLQQYAQQHMNDPIYGSTIVSMASYVANMKKAAQTPQATPNQPTVAQQAVQGIAPQPMMPQAPMRAPMQAPMLPENQGIGQLPAGNLENMAKGGIAAYAEGGEAEDDEEQDDDDMDLISQFMPRQEAHMQQGNDMASLPASVSYQATPNSETANITREEPGKYMSVTEHRAVARGTEDVKNLLKEAAEKTGAPEKLLHHIAQKETGGLKDRANAVSPAGAQGLMQLMPRTAKELGVTDPFDSQQSALGAGRYVNQLLTKYNGDEKLAAMAYNWGPGNVDKWLRSGADPSRIPGETRQYVAGLAQGGEVKRFDKGDLVYADPESTGLASLLDMNAPTLEQQRAQAMKEVNAGTTMAPTGAGAGRGMQGVQPQQAAPTAQPSAVPRTTSDYDLGIQVQNPYGPTAVADQQAAPAPAAPSSLDDMRAYIKQHMEDLKTEKQKNDAWRLINIGAAIASGTSPHALENIGKGILAGSSMSAESDKSLAAQQAALFGHQIQLENAVANQDINKAKMAMYGAVKTAAESGKEEARKGSLDLKQQQLEAAKNKTESDWMSKTEQNAINAHMAMLKGNQLFMMQNSANPDAIATQARLNAIKDLARNPRYVEAYKKFNGGASPLDGLPEVGFTGATTPASGWGQAKIAGS